MFGIHFGRLLKKIMILIWRTDFPALITDNTDFFNAKYRLECVIPVLIYHLSGEHRGFRDFPFFFLGNSNGYSILSREGFDALLTLTQIRQLLIYNRE